MPRYAPFEPRAVGRPQPVAAEIRAATLADVAGIVAVAATRGEQPAGHAERVARWVADDERVVLVAVAPDGVVGWGMASRWTPDDAPHGHVVSALTVHPRWWRAGLGARLLAELERWAWERGPELWSIVNVRNEASLALHLRHGFAEVRRAAGFGGVRFDGGEGTLLRAARPTTTAAPGVPSDARFDAPSAAPSEEWSA